MRHRRFTNLFMGLIGFLLVALIMPAMALPAEVHQKPVPTTEFPIEIASDSWIKDGTLFMTFHDTVNGSQSLRLIQNIKYMKHCGIDVLELRMWNPGGNVFAMLYILDILIDAKRNGITLNTVGMEVVMSAAVPIFMLGDTRTLNGLGFMMMHPIQWGGYGPPPSHMLELEKRLMVVYADIVSSNSLLDFYTVIDILSNEDDDSAEWFNASDALRLGLITSIRTIY